MIYIDKAGHLVSRDINKLHEFAKSIGLKRSWFQNHSRHPHYDCTSQSKIKLAIAKGAKLAEAKEIIKLLKDGTENG